MTSPEIKATTIETYNNSATELAEYFRGIGSRVVDIEYAIELSGISKPDVLEIGCGDGRDAKEILPRVGTYLGFDISEGLLRIAKEHVPDANFLLEDAVTYDYGRERFDIAFAFASLLHLDKEELATVIQKTHQSLRENGILFLSLKYADKYTEELKTDQYGTRMFYYYNPEIIGNLIRSSFIVEDTKVGFVTKGTTKWFEMALRKK